MKLFQNKRAAPQPESPHYEELAAEYRNYRRRTAQALERAEQEATRKVILEFLPLYDDLARALRQPCQDAAYFRGVELMMQKLLSILAAMKVQPMDSLHRSPTPIITKPSSMSRTRSTARRRSLRCSRPALPWMRMSSATQR